VSVAHKPDPPEERTPDVLARMRAGDRAAYKVLFDRYLGPLTGFLRSQTDAAFRSVVPIEDLAQDVHVEALKSFESFVYQRELSFYFWLCGIARNLVKSHCRRMKRQAPVLRRPIVLDGTTSSDLLAVLADRSRGLEQVAREENLHLLASALELLPERRRQAILLRYIEGHDSEGAAAILKTTPGSFRVLLSRALVELRDAFGEPITPPSAS
jgi:RNA polymerase sigma factor (sigma-70 family)